MIIIETWNNPNEFSWLTIEQENNEFYLFINNKNGVHRARFHNKDINIVKSKLQWNIDFALRMNETMKSIIKKVTENPELLKNNHI